jgi:OmpA-OmpF porin, OOP family
MQLTSTGRKTLRIVVGLLVLGGAALALRYAASHGYGRKLIPSFMAPKIEGLNDEKADAAAAGAAFADLPSHTPAALPGAPSVRIQWWAWNSQMGCQYANGGPLTTENSLMARQGVKLSISRQDDNSQLAAGLMAFAKALHDGEAQPTAGFHFTGIMGDGSHAFLAPLNEQIVKAFGPEYRAEIIGSCGYSRGEDKLMGPAKWRDSPQSMRGSVIAAVVRDGDWNIAVRFALDNQVPINPDETTYDPDAVNFVNTSSYTDAAKKYVENYCEDRKVVREGKATGETKHVCVEGAATWTPGDVTMAKERGGVVSVVSTRQYVNQMPHVIIGIRKWNQANRETVQKMLLAFAQGGEQVLTYPRALDRAAEISQEIYNEDGADAAYWKKYYVGGMEPDKQGQQVDLGGSKANNLGDMLRLFGLEPGSSPQNSRFRATYTVFGNLVNKMYPNLVPAVTDADSVADVSYLQALATQAGSAATGGKAETTRTYSGQAMSQVVGRRAVSIAFQSGSAALTPQGEKQLEQLANELTISDLKIVLNGYTDSMGAEDANRRLSLERATTVKEWLERRSPSVFPHGRVVAHGYGSDDPVTTNATEAGRARNRRVEILIGS